MEEKDLNISDDELCFALLLAAIFRDDLREEVLSRLGRIDTESTIPDGDGH